MFDVLVALLSMSLSVASMPAPLAEESSSSEPRVETFIPEFRPSHDSNLKDLYEPNNTLDTAVCLTPDSYLNYYPLELYITDVDAYLECGKNRGDYDFYYIKSAFDVWVTVMVSSQDDLFLSVGEYQYEVIQTNDTSAPTFDGELSHVIGNIYETENDEPGTLQTFKFLAHAGTYFVGVSYLTNDQTRSNNRYHLTVTAEPSDEGYDDINLEDAMFNRNLAGALWLLDSPLNGNFDMLKKPATVTYRQKAYPRIADPEYYLEDMRERANGQPVKFATYYLWDENLLAALRRVVVDAIEFLNSLEQGIEIKNQELTTNFDTAEKTLTIVATFVDVAGKVFKFVSVITDIVSFSLGAVNSILEMILPTLLTPTDTVKTFREMMERLADVLNKNVDQTGYRVIQIPLFLEFKEDKKFLVSKTRLMVDTTVTAKMLSHGFDFVLNDHQLSATDVVESDLSQLYRRGKFYGYQYSSLSGDELKCAPIGEYPVVPHLADPLSIQIPSSVSAYRGDYALRSFTAKKDGTYCVVLAYKPTQQELDLSTFNKIPIGYSDDGKFQTKIKTLFDSSHNAAGIYTNLAMKKGEKVYFRIKRGNYNRFDGASIVVYDTPVEPHDINYEWKTDKQHRKYCSCGDEWVEGHAVSSSDLKTCVLCHGSVSMGFVGLNRSAAKTRGFGNGSYLRPDGVYVLSGEDLPLLLAGLLSLPEA